MEPPTERHITTVPGATYAFTVRKAPTTAYSLNSKGQRNRIAIFKEEKAYRIDAITKDIIFCGGEIGNLEQVFTNANESNGVEAMSAESGEPISSAEKDNFLSLKISHGTWKIISSVTTAITLAPDPDRKCCHSTQLLIAPEADLSLGWLTSGDSELPIYWPFGEPLLVGGYRYCITLVQLPNMIVANMTPLGTV